MFWTLWIFVSSTNYLVCSPILFWWWSSIHFLGLERWLCQTPCMRMVKIWRIDVIILLIKIYLCLSTLVIWLQLSNTFQYSQIDGWWFCFGVRERRHRLVTTGLSKVFQTDHRLWNWSNLWHGTRSSLSHRSCTHLPGLKWNNELGSILYFKQTMFGSQTRQFYSRDLWFIY